MKLIQFVIPMFTMVSATGVTLADSGHGHTDHHTREMPPDHWMAPEHAAKQPNPIHAEGASLARGKKLYRENCTSCHGITGRGDGPIGASLNPSPANLAAMAPKHSAGDLAWKIAEGRNDMPAWKNKFSKDQIWDVVNYLRKGLPEPKKKITGKDQPAS